MPSPGSTSRAVGTEDPQAAESAHVDRAVAAKRIVRTLVDGSREFQAATGCQPAAVRS